MAEEIKTAETANEEKAAELELNEILKVRRAKLDALKAEGKNPFEKVKYNRTAYSQDIKDEFEKYENQTVGIAGRLVSKRVMGKASFAVILDGKGTIQSYLSINDLGDDYTAFKDYDIGDIIGITGFVFKTRTGEVSVHAKSVELLSKSLLTLPEKYHGLKDEDMRYRQREVDLIANPDVKRTFITRSKIMSAIRKYLDGVGYLEVDTPVLQPLEIGASARPFKTFHNALGIDMYLRIETELYLKRLIVGGFDKVYEVGRIFRNEGMDKSHNPEFTTVEMYEAYSDYHDMMNLIEDMYRKITIEVKGTDKITYQGVDIDMGKPWERLTMVEAVKKYAGVDYNDWKTDEEARAVAEKMNVEVEEGKEATKGHVLIAFFDAFVEDKLIQPTIIYDYPVENSPLAKRKASNPAFTERFEYFIYAREMGNAFSELNDPIDQRERFEKQVVAKRAKGGNDAKIDEDFVTALEYGLPPTGGLGFGVDRLVMLLTDSASIRDVILFPTMKPKNK
ncbi:MAG TPA: lysine--tRNA ligase [Clostridiales bacterium]|nr:lysine--tRNA ligase [Clostridiales bacterium]